MNIQINDLFTIENDPYNIVLKEKIVTKKDTERFEVKYFPTFQTLCQYLVKRKVKNIKWVKDVAKMEKEMYETVEKEVKPIVKYTQKYIDDLEKRLDKLEKKLVKKPI